MIRGDGIDILVDLALHTARNRRALFALKPAPVQVSYLGYCGTTGVEAIDYRLSDPYIDPPGSDQTCYSEETICLRHSYWCYQAHMEIEVASLPAIQAGFITFGCLNNFAKISPKPSNFGPWFCKLYPNRSFCSMRRPALAGRISFPFTKPRAFPRIACALSKTASAGLSFAPGSRSDIALDPFPYGGGITTCDALWMGVPVITLAGRTSVGRGALSILGNLGLPELVADSPANSCA